MSLLNKVVKLKKIRHFPHPPRLRDPYRICLMVSLGFPQNCTASTTSLRDNSWPFITLMKNFRSLWKQILINKEERNVFILISLFSPETRNTLFLTFLYISKLSRSSLIIYYCVTNFLLSSQEDVINSKSARKNIGFYPHLTSKRT